MPTEQPTDLTYSQAMAELEQIVAKMQQENCDIDSLTQMTARALVLLKVCKERLLKTDTELQNLLSALS